MTTTDTYQAVTDRVVAMLEQGTAPWQKPWTSPDGAPRSIEGYEYRGINVLLLTMTALEKGYTSPFWMTFKQAKTRGGKVRKGEKGTMIVFWKRLRITEKNESGKDVQKIIPMLRYYYVFNVEQTEGVKLPKKVADWAPSENVHEARVEAEAVLANYPNPPKVSETGTGAFYYPGIDQVEVPPRSAFADMDEFYSTLFHELGHSTGHPSRLNRKQTGGFGSHDYGREELVAEMTSAFLAAETGITTTFDNSAAYLNSWIRTIKEDVRAVVVAAGQAQRAVDHILGRTRAEETEDSGAGSDQPHATTTAA